MDREEIKRALLDLPVKDRDTLIEEVKQISTKQGFIIPGA